MASRPEQTYANHTRFDPPFHFVAVPLVLAMVALSLAISYLMITSSPTLLSVLASVWMIGLSAVAMFPLAFARVNALKVQDRVIAIEVERRYERLGGTKNSPLAESLEPGQLVALRFASDAELVALADRAAAEGLKNADIKKAITTWRPDYRRV